MKTQEIFNNFLETRKNMNFTTYKGIECNFNVWGSKLPKNANTITKKDIVNWVSEIRAKLAPETQAKVVSNVRMAFELAEKKDLFVDIKTDSRTLGDVNPFSIEETNLLIEKTDGNLKNYLAIAFHTGMRGGEILALQKEDIDLDKLTITVSKSVSDGICHNTTKTGKTRVIPLFKTVLPYLEEIIENDKWLFDNGRGNHYHNVQSLTCNGRWKDLLKMCGIKYKPLRQTRHTFATRMIDKAMKKDFSLMWVSYILGHSNLITTLKIYNRHIQGEHLKLDRNLEIY